MKISNNGNSTQLLNSNQGKLRSNFSPLGIWAFSIGTSIGWGSFIVTCSAYLQKAGILGTVFGLLIGMAKYENEQFVAPVFERADQNMYENKNELKNS